MTTLRHRIALLAGALLLAPLAASAQEDPPPEGVEIARDAWELPDALRPHADVDFTDTALVFTNASRRTVRVRCVGFDANGRVAGRIWLKVPPRGLRFALASDLSDGADFLGSARCRTFGRVAGSAFLLRPGAVTDLPSHHRTRLRPPLAEPVPQMTPAPDAYPGSPAGELAAALPQPELLPLRALGIHFPVVATY